MARIQAITHQRWLKGRFLCWSLARCCQETLSLYQSRSRRHVAVWFLPSSGSKTMSRWLSHRGRTILLSQFRQGILCVILVPLVAIPRLISVRLLVAPIAMLCNLGLILIHCILGTSWVKISDSHAAENSMPPYSEPSEELIRDALETLRNQLSIRQMFLEMPMEDLQSDLRRIVQLQRAIVLVLQIVEETASAVLHILVDREAQEEEVASLVDEVVDAGYGVDDGEDFDFDGNNVES